MLERTERERKIKLNRTKVITVTVPNTEVKEDINTRSLISENLSNEDIINQAIKLQLKGKIYDAKKYYQYCIKNNYNDKRVFSNLGVINQELGHIDLAIKLYKNSISLYPDYAEGYSNLANALIEQNKLKEAEIASRKAIELRPNLADAYNNLGIILIKIGKLKDAEISTRKAIEIKPNFIDAHNNLGNILRSRGKLIEAKESFEKAIKIKPDYSQSQLNLAYLYQDIGDYSNSNNSFLNVLRLRYSKTGDKLKALGQLILNSIIEGKFSQVDKFINYTKRIYNKKIPFDKYNFLINLSYELKEQSKHSNCSNYTRISHIGDSHCMSFSHQCMKLNSKERKIIPLYIKGAKAWHFANKDINKWKSSLETQIRKEIYSNEVLISFGEIDCRLEEGILQYKKKSNKNIEDICKKTINQYLNYMESKLSKLYSERYYFGIPAPVRENKQNSELFIKRKELIQLYNSILKLEVLSRGAYFIDVYSLTINKDRENNNHYMYDNIHLSPKSLLILFEKYLYMPTDYEK